MKRLVLLISAVGLLNFSYGQNHQISAGAGLLSTNAAFSILSKIGQNLSGSVFNGTTTTNGKFFGEFRGTYAYSPLKWLAIGTTFSYANASHDHVKNKVIVGHQTVNYYTFGAETSFYYMRKDHVRLYGLLGAGVTMMNQEDRMKSTNYTENRNYNYFNFQISPIGIEAGAENFGGFFELGFGYRGLLSIGAFVRL